jgi:hypothetical protein
LTSVLFGEPRLITTAAFFIAAVNTSLG